MQKVIVLALLVVLVKAWNLELVNKVNPCAGRSYCTINYFLSSSPASLCEGDSVNIDGGSIPATGLGIQENGLYCRCCGNEAGCINPDNAGMQLIINNGDCSSFYTNPPFYCGQHPPDAQNIVDIQMSGDWPNCVATLTRKSNAPNCQSSC
eukprot:TRINITY_DN1959_c1_g1_i1.p1 TRINITY_DN1959_c1_g1~~TRINITY_DN1959_c1_g1_i1.p1  ORF type:complete len:151 (+),score=27.87 TRINITY_DN1959_c1_g1_i1:90-542(+)